MEASERLNGACGQLPEDAHIDMRASVAELGGKVR